MTDAERKKYLRSLPLIALCFSFVAAGCQAPEPAGPKGDWTPLPVPESRLSLPIQELKSAPKSAVFRSADTPQHEEIIQWDAGPAKPAAGLRLSETPSGPALSDPQDPADIIAGWPVLQDKRPAISDSHTADNAYGAARWWRVGLGTSVCVMFAQRLDRKPPAAATLSGYFCNPEGLPMSPDAAETVVKSVRLRPAPDAP
jgi:hypothetical protein